MTKVVVNHFELDRVPQALPRAREHAVNKAGAMQQYYTLKNLHADIVTDLLRAIPKGCEMETWQHPSDLIDHQTPTVMPNFLDQDPVK